MPIKGGKTRPDLVQMMPARAMITKQILESFMKKAGKIIRKPAAIYLTGGSTAILLGFREGTIDIDMAGDLDELFSAIPKLKLDLNINIELAKPTDFVPSLPGENERHVLIGTFGPARFYHFDPYGQALSKIVRAHGTDIRDAKALANSGLVNPTRLAEMVKKLADHEFHRYPRLNRESVEVAVSDFAKYYNKGLHDATSE